MKRLLWRCDDFGSASGANEAMLALAGLGLPINVSVLVCGPEARRGLDKLAGLSPQICLGIHAAIQAEWDGVKWGPLSHATRATALVNDQGVFRPGYPEGQQVSPNMIAAEVGAQIEEAKSWGIPFSYMDEHMGFGWLPGVAELLAKLATAHGLVYRHELPGLPAPPENAGDLVERTSGQLDAVTDDVPRLAVFHPARDDASTKRFYNGQIPPGQVSRKRQQEFEALSSDRWRHLMTRDDISLLTYRELSALSPSLE